MVFGKVTYLNLLCLNNSTARVRFWVGNVLMCICLDELLLTMLLFHIFTKNISTSVILQLLDVFFVICERFPVYSSLTEGHNMDAYH